MSSHPFAKPCELVVPLVPHRDVASTGWSIGRTIREMYALRISYKEAIRAFQECFIVNVLTAHSGHLGNAAQALEIHRKMLTRLLRDLGIDHRQIRIAIRSSRLQLLALRD